jgi:hypothetical protein
MYSTLLQYGRTDLAAGHVPFKQMLFIHWAPTQIDPQDSDVQQYIILTCAVCYAAALGPLALGHWTLTSIALLYLHHHPIVALARMNNSSRIMIYSTVLAWRLDVDRQADSVTLLWTNVKETPEARDFKLLCLCT